MKRRKLSAYVLTVLFIILGIFIGRIDWGSRNFPFSVVVSTDGGEEELFCFEIWESYFVFLPAHTHTSDMKIRANPVYDIYIGDQLLTDGMGCDRFPLNEELKLYYHSPSGEADSTVTFLQSKNVGTMYIDVQSGNMEYIHQEKGNEERGDIQVYGPDGTLWHQGKLESIRGRGNATWWFDKKPYSITLRDPAPLLGMDAAQEWILLANAADPSILRNKLAFELAAQVGLPYSPECRWADLYLNGHYVGLYQLTERNEIHPQRIALDQGSFVVSKELLGRLLNQNYPYIQTDRYTVLRVHQSDLPAASMEQIWESAENAIFAEDGIDPLTGKSWMELIDLDSWAKKYLLEEIMGNYDADSISQFFYYDGASGKIFAGPVWDMDNTLGITQLAGAPNTILAGREHMWFDQDAPYYFALMEKDLFRQRVIELYHSVYVPAVVQLCETKLDCYGMQMSQAAQLNRNRWPGLYYQTDPEDIRTYLKARMSFLETYLENKEDYVTVTAIFPDAIRLCWALLPGENVAHLSQEKNYIWYDLETGELFDPHAPVYKNTVLQCMYGTE